MPRRTIIDRAIDVVIQLTPEQIDSFAQRLCTKDIDFAKALQQALSEVRMY